jgi:hypothetical protein
MSLVGANVQNDNSAEVCLNESHGWNAWGVPRSWFVQSRIELMALAFGVFGSTLVRLGVLIKETLDRRFMLNTEQTIGTFWASNIETRIIAECCSASMAILLTDPVTTVSRELSIAPRCGSRLYYL